MLLAGAEAADYYSGMPMVAGEVSGPNPFTSGQLCAGVHCNSQLSH
jgi:hypothetical protein